MKTGTFDCFPVYMRLPAYNSCLLNKLLAIQFVANWYVTYSEYTIVTHFKSFSTTPVQPENTMFRQVLPTVSERPFLWKPAIGPDHHFRTRIAISDFPNVIDLILHADAGLVYFIHNIMDIKKAFRTYITIPNVLVVDQNKITVSYIQSVLSTVMMLECHIVNMDILYAGRTLNLKDIPLVFSTLTEAKVLIKEWRRE